MTPSARGIVVACQLKILHTGSMCNTGVWGAAIMTHAMKGWRTAKMAGWAVLGCLGASMSALAATGYQPITPTQSDNMITLTGRDLTIEQVVDVARHGAKVQLSPEAKQRQADNYGLLLEAASEGVAVYWFNRGAGEQRETVMFSGDPLAPENKAYLESTQLQEFR